MQSTTATSLNQSQEILESSDALLSLNAIEPVIELAMAQTNVQGAFIYHFGPENTVVFLGGFGSKGIKGLNRRTASSGPAVEFIVAG